MKTAIEFENISKQYRLGLVSTGTLSHDLNRFWQTKIRGKEDPYLKIGEENRRNTKGQSDYVWALKDIDLSIQKGEVVGIIGKNGAGKSTLLKLLSRVTSPSTGVIRARGRIASLLEVGTGFHPEMTGRENIYMNGAIMGMNRLEITKKLDEIVDFSGCERYLDTPVKRYSSGMTVRLGFAIAAHLEPEILVVDEVLAVGDAEFQKKALGKMQSVAQSTGRTVLFVSHNMGAVKNLCEKGVLLENGCIAYHGDVHDTIHQYVNMLQTDFNPSVEFLSSASRYFNFTSLKIFQNGQMATPSIDVFDEISFELEYKLEKDDFGHTIFFVIEKEGTPLITLSDTFDNPHLFKHRSKGRYLCRFKLPTPLLKPGFYSVSLQYLRPRTRGLLDIDNALSFQVSLDSRHAFDAGFAKNRKGEIAVNPHWDIKHFG